MASILITGSDGQLGNELRIVSKNYYGYDFTFTDINDLDITDSSATAKFIKELKPDWIINCAAWTAVDKAEEEQEAAMLVNSIAVKNIVDAIKGSDCRLIHISSDYIYDGISPVPYDETATPGPKSAYGRSKLAGETQALLHPASMIIRSSWLYSSFGKNFVKTMLKLGAEKDSINVVFDQTGTPTFAADLASAIMSIVSGVIRNQFAFNAGVYNYSNEGVCSWYDFATEIMDIAGLNCHLKPVLSSEFIQAAKRPSYSVLNKAKIRENYNLVIPHWRSSLKRCMKLLGY
ncbi:MAG TPA: dTDP-4-dehydrorhamnose reductase [Bacteroidales bacterium]|nr:dTDP-4-dehydrorhamnose reductase [Bacteroidales bacterium]